MRTLSKISLSFLVFSILLGSVLSFPFQAKADFLSSFLGDRVFAQTDKTFSIPPALNSQTMDLLQANVSSASILQEKQDKNDQKKDPSANDTKEIPVDPNATANIVSDNAILPPTSPLGVSDGTDVTDPSSLETTIYVVRKGDTITRIAQMFDVSVNTILWANNMKKGDKLNEGDVLFILPISGRSHIVTAGQTLKSIAKLYKVDVSDIVIYNDITQDAKLAVGDTLIIPGADNMADEGGDKPAPDLGSALVRDQNYYQAHPLQNLIGYFINPVPTGRKTQGLHGPGHRGIDIGAPKGTPIYASASGVVTVVKTGCKVGQVRCGAGYGNMVDIEHSNGTKTRYAHMSKVGTFGGAQVKQGDIIGYVGNTGKSRGDHLHFEVFNAKNPGSDWTWANNN